ncbi:hypothetical protein MP228_008136 [Amoeboaphelidium protococcarum]|nr:hypothetical protein MP228_008136 [Amoeboaphelidium protococcarum]
MISDLIAKTKGSSSYPSMINPNSTWVNSKGAWTMNALVILILRIAFGIIPSVSTEIAWTLTNISYLTGHFILFHMIIGTPFDADQGEYAGLTLWEQIDDGQQFTPAKKYLTALPIFMFLLSTHYTRYDATLFIVNIIPLIVVLIAKLPALHLVRFFGINKVDD